jgi:hypothetical protein
MAPLRLLSRALVRLLGTPDTPGAFYKGLRTMAIDGFVVDLYDSPDNTRIFGKPQSGRSEGAFPQARVLALCETGSHVLYRWQVKPIARGESTMLFPLLRYLESDMLLLWDRAFLSYVSLQQVQATGAKLLARVKSNFVFKPTEVLSDGSFLAKMYPSGHHRDKDEDGIVVRIIEYTLEGRGKPDEVHRLLTTLLDAQEHPASELIMLDHERWEEEMTIDEMQTHQWERPVLRSQTPAGVIQEVHLGICDEDLRAPVLATAQVPSIDARRPTQHYIRNLLRSDKPEQRHRLCRTKTRLLIDIRRLRNRTTQLFRATLS